MTLPGTSTPFRFVVLVLIFSATLPSGIARADDISCNELLTGLKNKIIGFFGPERPPEPVPTMTELLASRLPADPEVIRLFVRDPKIPTMPHYTNNMIGSIQDAFAPWFRREHTESYAEMLRKQHRLLTGGETGEQTYLSTSVSRPLEPGEIGKFRHELPPTIDRAMLQFRFAESLGSLGKHPAPVAEFLKSIKSGEIRWISITEVPRKAHPKSSVLPKVFFDETIEVIFTQVYPERAHAGHYVEALEKTMETLRALPRPAELETLIPPLAATIKLFAAGLPFEKVNFSIAMSHVNFILMEHGYRGIENGFFDVYSMLLPEETFHSLLLETIRKAQP